MAQDHNDKANFGALPVAESAALTRKVTRLSVTVAMILSLLKLGAVIASGSIAVLASLADSALDIIAALGTFLAVRYAAAPPDREHRYGHGKGEAFASLLQAGLVFGSAALVGQEAVRHLIKPEPIQGETWALGVMAVSLLLTALLLRAQSGVLKQTHSVAVSGDRTHYAMDLVSNVAALIGIGAAAIFHSPRVVISHGLWISAPPSELRADVGHLMGHYAHHDQLSIALLLAALTFGVALAAWRLTVPMARLMGLRDIDSPANPVAAPALIAVTLLCLCLARSCDYGFIRWINVRADQYSLDHAREPDGLALTLLDEWNGAAVDPSPLQEALFYSHRPLRSRLENAMRWKAAHGG